MACDRGFGSPVDMILLGRGLLGNRSRLQAWLDTDAGFGRDLQRGVCLADHLKHEAERLGVSRLDGLRSSQAAFVQPPRA